MKICRICNKLKPLDAFYGLSRNKDGRDSRCKECVREIQKEAYHETKDVDKIKQRNLKVRYGLSLEQYNDMIENGCAVCGSFENLCIDHDHTCCPGKESCGKCLRGVLCWSHNIADGRFNTIQEIEKYLEYRKQHERSCVQQ